MSTVNGRAPIAARDWAAIARATQQCERAEHGPAELWYEDRHLQETAISSARAQCARAITAALDAGACTDEIIDAVLAGAPTLDHYEPPSASTMPRRPRPASPPSSRTS